jgi:hypothetical protein
MKHFNIHDLLHITVSSQLSNTLQSDLDFQIGAFRSKHDVINGGLRINLMPYDAFHGTATSIDFHGWRVEPAVSILNNEDRFAVERDGNQLTIYTDWQWTQLPPLIQALLTCHGWSYLHASSVADADGNVTIFTGPGGVGKTALVGELVIKRNYRVLSDDLVLVRGDGDCLAWPRPCILKDYHRDVFPEVFRRRGLEGPTGYKRWREAIRNVMFHLYVNMPLRGVLKSLMSSLNGRRTAESMLGALRAPEFLDAVPLNELFEAQAIVKSGKTYRVVFLERWSGSGFTQASMPPSIAAQRAWGILQHEWQSAQPLLNILGAAGLIDIATIHAQSAETLKALFERCNPIWVRVPDGTSPTQLAEYFIMQVAGID